MGVGELLMRTIMKIKYYYNKNLKMSPEKLAAQVGHSISRLTKDVQTRL